MTLEPSLRSPRLDLPVPAARPIFILGAMARVGTNYLQRLLELHPRGFAFPLWEDWFVAQSRFISSSAELLYLKYSSLGNQPVNPSIERAIFDAFSVGLESLIAAQLPKNSPELRPILRTPSTIGLERFFEIFPNADLLLLVRDGRDAVESMVRAFGSDFNKTARKWAGGVDAILSFDRAHAGRGLSYRIVRYEDLIDRFETELLEILRFLKLSEEDYDFSAAADLPVFGSSVFRGKRDPWTYPKKKDPRFNPQGRWKSWSPARYRAFMRIAGKQLEALGYGEPEVSKPRSKRRRSSR